MNQTRGLIAMGLFKDEEDVRSSPKTRLRRKRGTSGDIKYKDVNGDGVVNNDDIVPIGYRTVPNPVWYGIKYKLEEFLNSISCSKVQENVTSSSVEMGHTHSETDKPVIFCRLWWMTTDGSQVKSPEMFLPKIRMLTGRV